MLEGRKQITYCKRPFIYFPRCECGKTKVQYTFPKDVHNKNSYHIFIMIVDTLKTAEQALNNREALWFVT